MTQWEKVAVVDRLIPELTDSPEKLGIDGGSIAISVVGGKLMEGASCILGGADGLYLYVMRDKGNGIYLLSNISNMPQVEFVDLKWFKTGTDIYQTNINNMSTLDQQKSDNEILNDALKQQFNMWINEEDLKKQPKSTLTTSTVTINTGEDDGLTPKERLVQELVQEGAIDIKEALTLLEKEVKVVEIPKENLNDWVKSVDTGTPYPSIPWISCYTSGVKSVSSFA